MQDVYAIGAFLRERRKEILSVVAVFPLLYIAWFLSWFGTVATTCTQASTDSIRVGLVISTPFFAVAILFLGRYRLGVPGLLLALPLIYLLTQQAAWAVELYNVVNISGRSACTLMMGDDFGEIHDGWVERAYAPYYFALNVSSLLAIAWSFWRSVTEATPTKVAGIFD